MTGLKTSIAANTNHDGAIGTLSDVIPGG